MKFEDIQPNYIYLIDFPPELYCDCKCHIDGSVHIDACCEGGYKGPAFCVGKNDNTLKIGFIYQYKKFVILSEQYVIKKAKPKKISFQITKSDMDFVQRLLLTTKPNNLWSGHCFELKDDKIGIHIPKYKPINPIKT